MVDREHLVFIFFLWFSSYPEMKKNVILDKLIILLVYFFFTKNYNRLLTVARTIV